MASPVGASPQQPKDGAGGYGIRPYGILKYWRNFILRP